MVIALRGSAGKRWQRKHTVVTTTGKPLNVGTPHHPMHIPVVNTPVYLGVVASYGGFELQTLQHRQKAAAQNRHHPRERDSACTTHAYEVPYSMACML